MNKILFIHGTWGLNNDWWRPANSMAQHIAQSSNMELISAQEPFKWSGRLSGLIKLTPSDPEDSFDDSSVDWAISAQHLSQYVRAVSINNKIDKLNIIAHSHGGQIALLALAYNRIKIDRLITVSTPVRNDLKEVRKIAINRLGADNWLHLHGDFWKDWFIKLGELGDGRIGWKMKMPELDDNKNIHLKGFGHSNMLTIETFQKYGIWDYLNE